jgi:hypothetical protein
LVAEAGSRRHNDHDHHKSTGDLHPMKRRFFSRLVAAALASAVFGGCANEITAPTADQPTVAPDANPGLITDLLKLVALPALTRKTALATDVTASAVIGANGGTITIPIAGFTLVVPPKAVSQNTTFKVTAIKGKMVAYEFEPHGTTFPVALQATQDLRVTNWLGLNLLPMKVGYFADRSQLDTTNNVGLVSEVVNVVLNLLKSSASFNIKHFSGYMISWG